MSLFEVVEHTQLFFLIFARVFMLLRTAPLLSGQGVPGVARVGLCLMATWVVLPWIVEAGYPIPETGLGYALLVVGEGLVGVTIGMFMTLVFTTFQTAGQFFSLQMGFGASQVFDPLSQVEIPLVGQFFNLVAMFVFVTTAGFNHIFLVGVLRSFEAIRAVDILQANEELALFMMHALSALFAQALVISMPILGTLMLVNISLGLMAKAAPQMNLLMIGFPMAILVAFGVMFLAMPVIMGAFDRLISGGWEQLHALYRFYGGLR